MSDQLTSINPATGETIKTYTQHSQEEALALAAKTHSAFQQWRRTDFATRATRLEKMADLLEQRKTELAAIITGEMGKVKKEAVGEIEKCAWVCRYYAENGAALLKDEAKAADADKAYVTYQPLGVVLAVMPWNFPFWQVFRFAVPTLMAGNGALLKHAANVSGCALAIEKLFKGAGFPEDIFNTLLIDKEKVKPVIESPSIHAVTLTGSTGAGRAVAAQAGAALKPCVLELGGSDPYIILEDADIKEAAKTCAASRMLNAGQSCIAAKRFIVVDSVHDDFVAGLKSELGAKTMGDPMDDNTNYGPQAEIRLRDALHSQVEASIAKGAQCLMGGELPSKKGAWYPATLLTDVKEGMPAYHEEMFGPVASVIKVKDRAEAIKVANDSDFGLGGAVFTSDIAEGERIAREEINSGSVAVNDFVKSDPRLPFGGVKDSGFGRELSAEGIRAFTNVKTVCVQG